MKADTKDPILAQVDDGMIAMLIRSKDDIGGFNERFPEFRINKLVWPKDSYTGVVEHVPSGRQFKIEVSEGVKKVDEIAPYKPYVSQPEPIQYNTEVAHDMNQIMRSNRRTSILSIFALVASFAALIFNLFHYGVL